MTVEDRLRATTGAVTEAMRPVRPLTLPPGQPEGAASIRPRRGRLPRRWPGWLIPLAAAVAVIAVAATLVAVRDLPGGQLAPRGTPVLAADYGRVLRMRSNPAGGITIYEIDAGNRYVYYYAHLDHYASTLTEGKDVVKGEIIGYVGTTGNAPANVPHLHFQLMKRPNAARWWDGEPIDPKPFLTLPGRPAGGS